MNHADPEAPQALRIAAVPASHPYVQNLFDPELAHSADAVTVLRDPHPAGAAPGQWWPPVMLDAGWIAANADSFDLLHVHFGVESFTLGHLQEVVDALRHADRPLVFTVHDLTNPQLADQRAHLAQLELLVSQADEVVTLTEGARSEIRARWGRDAVVVPHPRVVPATALPEGVALPEAALPESALPDAAALPGGAALPEAAPDARDHAAPVVIGLHLRDLRPNIDALTAVDTLLAATSMLRASGLDLCVVVDLNDRVRSETTRAALRARLEGVPFAELREHPRFSDPELRESLLHTDISVMPYGHGTHSGWLELCWDLGVAVAAPALGFYAEQHPASGEVATFERGSADSLARALLELLGEPAAPRQDAAATAGGAAAPVQSAAAPVQSAAAPVDGAPAPTSAHPRAEQRAARTRAAHRAQLRREHAAVRDAEQRSIHLAHLTVYRRALARARV